RIRRHRRCEDQRETGRITLAMILPVMQHALRLYKAAFSPSLLSSCRFTPTCSEYATEACARHGIFRGGMLSAWRILRCNPFAHGGLDLVPTKLKPIDARIHTCQTAPMEENLARD